MEHSANASRALQTIPMAWIDGIEALRGLLRSSDRLGDWVAPLGLRLLLAYEFWVSGVEKLSGENWFIDIQDQFPFPFNSLPAEVSWHIATWTELIGPVALVLGLGTRLTSLALSVLTVVAWISVHAGNGYNVVDNGWKLPLFYLIMFLPLLLRGAGQFSLDRLIAKRWFVQSRQVEVRA